jgi:hypothetical protein
MTPSPLSLDMLPTTLATWTAFLPPAAALWRRRAVGSDPAAWLGASWLLLALAGSITFVRFFLLGLSPRTPLTYVITALYPPLFLSPTLSWIGGRAKRWQWPVLAAWAAAWVAAVVALHGARQFKTIMDPIAAAGLGALSVVALATQVRRAPTAIRRADWFWILTGQVMYFAVTFFREPILEALVSRDWGAVIAVNNAIMLLFTVAYLVIARGMLLAPHTADVAPSAPATVRRIA